MTAFNKVVNTKHFGWFPGPFGNTGPFESLVTTTTSDRSEPLDVNSGCFTLQMSGDDFGITVYNSSFVKTISVPIFFFHLNQHHEFYLLFPPVNSDGD